MFRLTRTETFEQDIKKSRFLAIAAPVADEADAKDFIARHADPAATHNCWAWRLGQAYRFSDDGEPSGTAGKPILQALDGQELDHAAVLVIRWFGGILLGSGGLIRAYGGTAALCLRSAEKSEFIPELKGSVAAGFSDIALLKARLLAMPGLRIDSEAFGDKGVVFDVAMPACDADAIGRMIVDLTSGRSSLRIED